MELKLTYWGGFISDMLGQTYAEISFSERTELRSISTFEKTLAISESVPDLSPSARWNSLAVSVLSFRAEFFKRSPTVTESISWGVTFWSLFRSYRAFRLLDISSGLGGATGAGAGAFTGCATAVLVRGTESSGGLAHPLKIAEPTQVASNKCLMQGLVHKFILFG
jgi:hypothetical protein